MEGEHARKKKKTAWSNVEKSKTSKSVLLQCARDTFRQLSYLAAQLRDGTHAVDQGVGGTVGPADAEH